MAAASFTCLWSQRLVNKGSETCAVCVLSPDFHEVWPTEVETERQNRSEWQAELGWRGNGVPASDHWTNFHQGTVVSSPSVVSWCHSGMAPLVGTLPITSACCPLVPQTPLCTTSTWRKQPLSYWEGKVSVRWALEIPTSDFSYALKEMTELARNEKGKECPSCLICCPLRPFLHALLLGHRSQRAGNPPPGGQRDLWNQRAICSPTSSGGCWHQWSWHHQTEPGNHLVVSFSFQFHHIAICATG